MAKVVKRDEAAFISISSPTDSQSSVKIEKDNAPKGGNFHRLSVFDKDEYVEVQGKTVLKSRMHLEENKDIPEPTGFDYNVGFYRPAENYIARRNDLLRQRDTEGVKKLDETWIRRMLYFVRKRNMWPPSSWGGMFCSSGYYDDYYVAQGGIASENEGDEYGISSEVRDFDDQNYDIGESTLLPKRNINAVSPEIKAIPKVVQPNADYEEQQEKEKSEKLRKNFEKELKKLTNYEEQKQRDNSYEEKQQTQKQRDNSYEEKQQTQKQRDNSYEEKQQTQKQTFQETIKITYVPVQSKEESNKNATSGGTEKSQNIKPSRKDKPQENLKDVDNLSTASASLMSVHSATSGTTIKRVESYVNKLSKKEEEYWKQEKVPEIDLSAHANKMRLVYPINFHYLDFTVFERKRIRVSNIPETTTMPILKDMISRGEIVYFKKRPNYPGLTAMVKFRSQGAAAAFLHAFQGTEMNGQKLDVKPVYIGEK